MDATSNWLGRHLLQRIQDARASKLDPLIAGKLQDFAAYKASAAYLEALDDLEDWIKDARLDADDQRPANRRFGA